jgi:dihydrofolate reductase
MGKIVVTEFVSVDGVSDDPAGVEGFERGGWSFRPDSDGQRVRLRGEEGEELLLAENRNAAALLLGRKTYEFLAGFFPQQEGRALADVINSMPKYVVSSTLVNAEWNNSRGLSGEPADEVGRLKREIDGEILLEDDQPSGRSCRLRIFVASL